MNSQEREIQRTIWREQEAEDVQKEWDYRYQERLGILCGSDKPTQNQDALAREEADKWKSEYLQEQSGELKL